MSDVNSPDFSLLMEAANHGNPEAQYSLGELFENGKNYVAAAAWHCKASEQGYAPAQCQLGALYTFDRCDLRGDGHA